MVKGWTVGQAGLRGSLKCVCLGGGGGGAADRAAAGKREGMGKAV